MTKIQKTKFFNQKKLHCLEDVYATLLKCFKNEIQGQTDTENTKGRSSLNDNLEVYAINLIVRRYLFKH